MLHGGVVRSLASCETERKVSYVFTCARMLRRGGEWRGAGVLRLGEWRGAGVLRHAELSTASLPRPRPQTDERTDGAGA